MSSPDPGSDHQTARLAGLLRTLRTFQHRYGGHVPEPVGDLERALSRRTFRITHLRRQLAEMGAELARLEREAAGIRTGMEARLLEVIERYREARREAWSPTPVRGFRFWVVDGNVLRGFRRAWPTPELEAVCSLDRSDDEVPHSDGRCGRLGCGIYAVKDPAALLAELRSTSPRVFAPDGPTVVVGLVDLSGKVVEHRLGYRARRARAVAVAVVDGGSCLTTADDREIRALFAHPGRVGGRRWNHTDPGDAEQAVAAFLERELERRSPWTSVNSNG